MADNNTMVSRFFLVAIWTILMVTCVVATRYEPNWESIDKRPLPSWYDESKIGIFIHWGVFSVPSLISEWFWYDWKTQNSSKAQKFMKDNYKPDWTYQDFADQFTAELFNPDEWADIFGASGARYVVLTSKHHEGFTNWPSKYSFSWNSMDVGPNRDLVGSLADSIRKKTSMRFGLYHSLFEWYNPLYLQDKANKFQTQDFVKFKTLPELYEIVNTYKPEVIWSDGDWEAKDVYWNSTDFLAWLYNDSPVKDTVVTNDRWGSGCACHHGGYYTCSDRYNPGKLQNRKWENCMTIDKASWGYRRDAKISDMLTMEELITTLVETVSCGGNILINVGPTHDGRIVPVFEERLRSLGQWLDVNGEAIYSSKPWTFQNDTETPAVWYTAKKPAAGGMNVYALVLKWPSPGDFYLASPTIGTNTKVTLLGYDDPIACRKAPGTKNNGIILTIPAIPFNKMPCDYAWVFKMENLAEREMHVLSDANNVELFRLPRSFDEEDEGLFKKMIAADEMRVPEHSVKLSWLLCACSMLAVYIYTCACRRKRRRHCIF
ncbi:alpha-L-fucosidase-like isoform X1 [Ruditapes philippinarum]|uniref:alpha-L-fucosidase-like isoform X1 n=1 Tax=Ruditapes philippinarum TaxID=129788 RepID=UPI00295A5D0A|nr:alpha-L-fucosidase-like isoform X1 [Ruditapes philippinarum]